MAHTRKITAGPSREEIFDSLRLFNEGRTVRMTVDGLEGPYLVQSIEAEDGSGHSWNLVLVNQVFKTKGAPVKAWYNDTRRTGTMIG